MMHCVLRSSLGVALALPLLLGTSGLAASEALATSQAPTVVAQIAPQQKHDIHCHDTDQGRICHEHESGHQPHHHSH
ncbi:hypothetical protein [Saccharopolyspora spinosa]